MRKNSTSIASEAFRMFPIVGQLGVLRDMIWSGTVQCGRESSTIVVFHPDRSGDMSNGRTTQTGAQYKKYRQSCQGANATPDAQP